MDQLRKSRKLTLSAPKHVVNLKKAFLSSGSGWSAETAVRDRPVK